MIETHKPEENFDWMWNIGQCIKFALIATLIVVLFAMTVLWHINPNMIGPKPDYKRSINTTVVDMEREILSRKIYQLD